MMVGVQVTKQTLFRGVQQPFNNTYYYNLLTATSIPAQAIIDEIVAREKEWHSTAVTFVKASAWSAGGSTAQNQMIVQQALSGAGTATTITSMDRERAVLIRWPAGYDIRGLPVYLRKWYHTLGAFGPNVLSDANVLANTGEIALATRQSIATAAASLNQTGVGESWDLCSKTGRKWVGQPECHRYLEHHQLGDQWR